MPGARPGHVRLNPMFGRIVITGAGGQLGGVLAAQAADKGYDVLALTSSQWDITDPEAARLLHAIYGMFRTNTDFVAEKFYVVA